VLQRPLSLGADVVVHSATKFLCGHGDVIAGAVVVRDEALAARVAFHQNAEGAGLSPFDSWLLLRGMKTLALRVERQTETARRVAAFLGAHPAVERVFYPGAGAVISFTTGDAELSRRVAEAAELFAIAVSFGGVSSVISLPCRMSHASTPPEVRERHALPEDLVRLSVGIEDAEDLVGDLARALAVGRPAAAPQALPTRSRMSSNR
jgi:cystathionine beta-lyase